MELRSFLGMINDYGKVMPNMSTKLAQLYKLLRKVRYKEQESAYQEANEALQTDSLLVHYDEKTPWYLLVICMDLPLLVVSLWSMKYCGIIHVEMLHTILLQMVWQCGVQTLKQGLQMLNGNMQNWLS